MTKQTTDERLAVLETKMDTVIEQQKDMNEKIGQLLPAFATKTEIENLKKEIEEAKKKNALYTWLTGSLAAVFGSILTILVKAYFE